METFAPIGKLNATWILPSLLANFDWKLLQLDKKNAFFYGELKEYFFMDPL